MEGVVGADSLVMMEEVLNFLDSRAGEARRICAALITKPSTRLAKLFVAGAGAWDHKRDRSARDGGGSGAYGQHV